MKVVVEYNLPDELDLFKRALADKQSNSQYNTQDLKDLRNAILQYMLRNDNDSLMNLNNLLEKYSDA